jgi:hypothetical protein
MLKPATGLRLKKVRQFSGTFAQTSLLMAGARIVARRRVNPLRTIWISTLEDSPLPGHAGIDTCRLHRIYKRVSP